MLRGRVYTVRLLQRSHQETRRDPGKKGNTGAELHSFTVNYVQIASALPQL